MSFTARWSTHYAFTSTAALNNVRMVVAICAKQAKQIKPNSDQRVEFMSTYRMR